MPCAFIIPTLNEISRVSQLVSQLQTIAAQGHEVLVVDGGSQDGTDAALRQHGFTVYNSPPGRAKQMNVGARNTSNDILVFLHADTILPEAAVKKILHACCKQDWGRFDVSFNEKGVIFKLIATMMNFRSCISGIVTGDQCLFVKRELFNRVGGYPDIPLMEDIALSKKLKKFGFPVCLHDRVITSARRWKQNGVLNTILLMWYLRFAYAVGVSPYKLHRFYYGK